MAERNVLTRRVSFWRRRRGGQLNAGENQETPNAESLSDWRAFFRDTTLHGVRFFLLRPGQPRGVRSWLFRLLWLLLLGVSAGSFLYFTAEAIRQFLKYETTTHIEVKLEKELPFPAITICNFNVWMYSRILEDSEDPDKKTASLLCAVYHIDPDIDPSCLDFIDKGSLDPRSLTEIYEYLGQYARELIPDLRPPLWEHGCQWGSSKCSAMNFTQTLSEYGNCYTFNADKEEPLVSSTPGRGAGLRLTLNVNQYEYVSRVAKGNTAVGLIIFVHPQHQPYLAHHGGFAISPGTETFVALRAKKYIRLPEPYNGPNYCVKPSIGSETLNYYKVYSFAACIAECKTRHLAKVCGCRMPHMPPLPLNPGSTNRTIIPVCSLHEAFTCGEPESSGWFGIVV